MGSTLSCVGRVIKSTGVSFSSLILGIPQVPSMENIEYDLSPIQNKNLPMIWMAGQQNTGKKTHGEFIKEKYSFEILNTTDLLRREANKETKRGLFVKEALSANKHVNDRIVIDLLKEALLESNTDKGFLISNFPKNSRQAEFFIKEIGNVTFIFYLFSDTPLLIERAQRRSLIELDEDTLRRNIAASTRDIKAGLTKFIMKIEGINTSGRPEEVFPKVETALIRRLNTNRPIITEADYVQAQKEGEETDQEVIQETVDTKQANKLEQMPLHTTEPIEEKVEECSLLSESDLF